MLADNQATPAYQVLVSHLICKGLWWIVNNDGLWEISSQNVEILDVVSLDTDTMLTKQPVPAVTVGEERGGGGDKVSKISKQLNICFMSSTLDSLCIKFALKFLVHQ